MTTKMKIYALDRDAAKEGRISPKGFIQVAINPDQITFNRKGQVNSDAGGDTTGTNNQTKGKAPDTASFDLYFDGTGAIDGKTTSVNSQIESLFATVFEHQDDIHMANVLNIIYGKWNFVCTTDSFNTTYTLFKPSGEALRAKVSLSFTQYTKPEKKAAGAGQNSPDMTHTQLVRDGDGITLYCQKTYDDVGHYIDVARHNGLVNFRKLEAGSNLYLPPLEK